MNFLEVCEEFIACESTPSNGNRELAALAADYCRQIGLQVSLQEFAQDNIEQANVIARWGSEIPAEEVMLQTHLDTIEPGHFSQWTKTGANPFHAIQYQGQMFGLGTADCKLDFVCKLEALRRVGRLDFRRPPVLVGTYGEETGMIGAFRLLKRKMVRAKTALVGEATGLQLITRGKGFARVELTIPFSEDEQRFRTQHDNVEISSTMSKIFHGESAHSSSGSVDDNAIIKMLEHIARLPENVCIMDVEGGINDNTIPDRAFLDVDFVSGLSGTMTSKLRALLDFVKELHQEFSKISDPTFSPATATFNIGRVRTEEAQIRFGGSVRIPPAVSEEVSLAWLSDFAEKCKSIGGSFALLDFKRPFRQSEESVSVQVAQGILKEMGLENEARGLSATNEASVFHRFGLECLVFGPGSLENNAHTPHESVSIEALEKAVVFYEKMIRGLCL